VQGDHRLVDVAVLRAIEVGRSEEVGDLQNRVGVDEDRAEDALLGLDRLRRQAVRAYVLAGSAPAILGRQYCRDRSLLHRAGQPGPPRGVIVLDATRTF
jgi:hypothetical protein